MAAAPIVAPVQAIAFSKNVRRLKFTIRHQIENCCAGNGDPAGDAVVAGPRAILILQLQNLVTDLRIPSLPFLTAGASQAIADVQVGEELLSTDRTIAFNKLRIGKLTIDGIDLFGV